MKEIFALVNKNYTTHEQVKAAVSAVMDNLIQFKDSMSKNMAKMDASAQSYCEDCMVEIGKVEKSLIAKLADLKTVEKSDINDVYKTIEQEMNAIKKLIPDLTEIRQKIEAIKRDTPKPQTPPQLRDALESLKGDQRLDQDAIKGLKEEIEAIRSEVRAGNGSNHPIVGSPVRRKQRAYSLTSQCNGVTKVFTLPLKTMSVIGVFGSEFPVNFDAINDWTFAGHSLTLGAGVSAPATGQTLWVLLETL